MCCFRRKQAAAGLSFCMATHIVWPEMAKSPPRTIFSAVSYWHQAFCTLCATTARAFSCWHHVLAAPDLSVAGSSREQPHMMTWHSLAAAPLPCGRTCRSFLKTMPMLFAPQLAGMQPLRCRPERCAPACMQPFCPSSTPSKGQPCIQSRAPCRIHSQLPRCTCPQPEGDLLGPFKYVCKAASTAKASPVCTRTCPAAATLPALAFCLR